MTKIFDYLTGFTAKFYLGVIALLLAAIPLTYCSGQSNGKAVERGKQQKAANAALVVARTADAKAADHALADQIATTKNEEQRRAAIESAKDSVPDDANFRLACSQLRQAGVDTPATCP